MKNFIKAYRICCLMVFFTLLASCGKKIEESANNNSANAQDNNPQEGDQTKTKSNLDKESLFDAILANDSNLISVALKNNDHIDYHFENGQTPLTMAILSAKTEIISILIHHAKNLNLKNTLGDSPLHLAIHKSNDFIINLLINKNVDLNLKNKQGLTPLIYSLKKTYQEISVKLITQGANLSDTDQDGRTVYMIATDYRLFQVLEFLNLIREFDEFKNIDKLEMAIPRANTDFVEYLLVNHQKLNPPQKVDNYLNLAMEIDDDYIATKMIEKLIQRGANINQAPQDELPPIIKATILKKYNIISKLLDYRVDLTIADADNKTALDHASFNLDKKAVDTYYSRLINQYINDQEKIISLTKSACNSLPTNNEIKARQGRPFHIKNDLYSYLKCSFYADL